MTSLTQSLKYIDNKFKKGFLTLFLLHLDWRSRGIVFRKPKNQEEIDAMYKLRYRVYCEEYHFLDPAKFPNKMEIDEFDEHSEYVVAIKNEKDIIGCVRLIKPNDKKFPTEEGFHVTNLDKNNTVEISRLIVEKPYRSTKVGIGLYRGIYRVCAELGYTYILESMEK